MITLRRTACLLVLCAGAMFLASSGIRAQSQSNELKTKTADQSPELARHMEDLQKQIDVLQGELTMIKKQMSQGLPAPVTPAASATPTAPQAPTPATGTSSTSPAAPTVASLLGPLNVTGFVDGYYSYNFNHPHVVVPSVPPGTPLVTTTGTPSGTPLVPLTGFRAFDSPAQQLSLNMAELILAKDPDPANSRLGFKLAFGFGNAMNVVNSTDPGGLGFAQYLKEAYLSYLAPLGKGLQFDFGKFVTPFGAEVIETKDNWNYSRSLLFTYAIPFYHFGLRAKYAFNDKYSLTGYVVNGWNNIVDNNTGKSYGVSLGLNPSKKFGVTQTYMAGPEQPGNNSRWRQLSDTVVTYSPTGKLSLMANYDYGRDHPLGVAHPSFWTGVAGYLKYAFNDKYALATRYEYFDDHAGFTTGAAQHLNEVTATFERKIAGNLITRLEYRHDSSDHPTFAKGTRAVDGQDTVAAGLIYTFDLKELK